MLFIYQAGNFVLIRVRNNAFRESRETVIEDNKLNSARRSQFYFQRVFPIESSSGSFLVAVVCKALKVEGLATATGRNTKASAGA
jgi:hypothetical protein